MRNARAARSGPSRSFQLPVPSPRTRGEVDGLHRGDHARGAGSRATRSSGQRLEVLEPVAHAGRGAGGE